MASYQIPAPPPLLMKGDMPTNWKVFKQAWDYFVIATELSDKSDAIRAATLCSVMGPESVKVMNTLTTLTAEDKLKPEPILEKLGEHFTPQRHVLMERSNFLDIYQTEHESIDQFVVRLWIGAETCEYEALEESLIRDKLCGTTDTKIGQWPR